jgi:peptide/nickel transport system substrate-binding protein
MALSSFNTLISPRRLALLGLSTLSLALLHGCNGGGEKFAGTNTAAPNGTPGVSSETDTGGASGAEEVAEPVSLPGKYGGTLTDAAISDPKTFNFWAAAEQSSYAAAGPLLDTLLARNAYTQEWEGHLAELPTVSADNKTFTFTLKPDLKWSDGQPLTTDDIIFTLQVIFDPKVQTNIRESMLLDVPDGKGGFKRVPLGYKKIDARTIEFTFPAPYAPAREILSFPIAPRHKLEGAFKSGQPNATQFNSAWGVNANVKDFVSCGPWVLISYVPGQRLIYARNPHYWKKDKQGRQLPYLERYVSLIVPDLNAITLKFRSGETDVTSIQHTDFPSFKKDEAKGNYKTMNLGPSESTNFVSFNLNPKSVVAKRKPHLVKAFRDARFRRAVAHAINRQRISDQVFLGLASPLYGPETPANKKFYNPNIAKYDYSPEKAKALFAEMGLKDGNGNGVLEMDGKDISFNLLTNVENNQRKTMAAIITDDLKKVGLGANFTPITFNVMVSKLDAKPQPGKPYPPFDWESVMLSFGGGGVDPHNGRNIWTSSGNLHQWYPYQEKPDTAWEAEIDKIFREGAQQMDEAKRKEMYARWQQIVSEQQPLVYTITPNVLAAVRNRFGNVKPSNNAGVTWNTEEWFDLKATKESL